MKRIHLLVYLVAGLCYSTFAQDRIYWGDQNADNIRSVNASDLGSLLTPVSAQNPSGIAYYHANPTYPLFFAGASVIYRNNLAGTTDGGITTANQFNRGVVIDYIGKKLYWANSQLGTISRADLDGANKNESFMTGLSSPWDIDIDPVNQKIYWTEDVSGGAIKRANLSDGSSVETVITVQSIGVAVDPLRSKIYYTEFGSSKVYGANINGTGAAQITGLSAVADIDVDHITGKLFMVDYNSGIVTKADADGSNKSSILYGGTFIEYADVTVPTISFIIRQNPSSVNAYEGQSATFRVAFSEPVLNLNAADFELGGPSTGPLSVNHVSLNTIYDITVSNISGTGTLNLNIAAAHNLIDFKGNSFSGTITTEQMYTVIVPPTPTVTSFTPTSGAVGTTVTITGTDFSATPAENTVTFNGVAATVTASSSTSITTTVPALATTGPIAVTVYGMTGTSANNFTVLPTPTITSFSPTGGPVATTVVITGTNFSGTPADNTVMFNGVAATVTASTTTSITTTVPSNATTGAITVAVNGVTGTSANNFAVCTIPAKPTITRDGIVLTSSSNTGNQWLRNDIDIPGATNKTLTLSEAGTYKVRVTAGECSTLSDPLTLTTADLTPTITSFSPVGGSVGTTVTITGTNFSSTPANNTVTFNGVAATVTASTSTSFTTTVPATATTGAIAVTVNGVTGTSANSFIVCIPPAKPTITKTEKVLTSSSDTGNQWLKNGVDIAGATNKTFTLTQSGTYTVRVTAGACSTLSDPITITEADLTPSVTSFSPTVGPIGTTVTITGANFSSTPASNAVTFNGVAATVTASTTTSLTTTVPATATSGAIAVTVDGRTGTSTSNFTVCTVPPKPTITSNGGLLTSSSSTGNQWLKNNVDIAGATNNTYSAVDAGAYSVRVTVNGCSSVSDPTTITDAEENISDVLKVYPNPARGIVRIEVESSLPVGKAEIYSVMGLKKDGIILSPINGKLVGEVDMTSYSSGVYLFVVSSDRVVRVVKLRRF